MDFKSFRETKCSQKTNKNNIDARKLKAIEDEINTYSKMSDAEMMQSLYREVNLEKSKGIFDIQNLRKFYLSIAPMLENTEREKMRNIIDAIEKG